MASDTTPKVAYAITVTWGGHDCGYLVDAKGPGMKADIADISNHDSPNSYKQFAVGLIDGGEVTLELRYITGDVTGQKQMLTDFNARTERSVIMTYSDTTSTWTFNGIITGFDVDAGKYDAVRKLTVTIKVNGKPTYAYT